MSDVRPTQEQWAAVEAAMKHEAEEGWQALIERYLDQHPERRKRLEGLSLRTQIELVQSWLGGAKFAAGVVPGDAKWAGY